jgi:NTP pyrophosphatase (non-canonical NTP hydrolase)
MSEVGKAVTEIDNWLDSDVPEWYTNEADSGELAQHWARIAKLTEESGEVVDAFIGWTGQNPRKGMYSSREEVLSEMADVAATAVLAIQHFTKDWRKTEEILWDKLVALRERVPGKYRQE